MNVSPTLAAFAFSLIATTAGASNHFGNLDGLEKGDNTYDVNLVRADAAGIVQIETINGDIVGTAKVRAGANSNVHVPLKGNRINSDVFAKLIVNGQVEDVQRIQAR